MKKKNGKHNGLVKCDKCRKVTLHSMKTFCGSVYMTCTACGMILVFEDGALTVTKKDA